MYDVCHISAARRIVGFACHFRMDCDLNLEAAEFLELGLCDFGEALFSAGRWCALSVAGGFSRRSAGGGRFSTRTSEGRGVVAAWHLLRSPSIFCCVVD